MNQSTFFSTLVNVVSGALWVMLLQESEVKLGLV